MSTGHVDSDDEANDHWQALMSSGLYCTNSNVGDAQRERRA
jgi:hypothetical protein